jgi:hypothetical protein
MRRLLLRGSISLSVRKRETLSFLFLLFGSPPTFLFPLSTPVLAHPGMSVRPSLAYLLDDAHLEDQHLNKFLRLHSSFALPSSRSRLSLLPPSSLSSRQEPAEFHREPLFTSWRQRAPPISKRFALFLPLLCSL